ncbi:iron-containing alcohol dehydrogenase [Dissulfurirhabdus thermomarina]|uniref:Iron-containing alcohol dehydrogenase n=1 Tax=Dissulfurirhabdus thermomarina TaxID=1765737 RepID=A0A6N9TSG0_DISTH|nr:iron-containing alcohol dehydrogenase [Dissulfurirhabdus thermomarina]NDY42684.1 iron-containing alcohol dehydrogenase [Dissulfurirhabdus thermomarina]NMX24098.1 iron-containing alcohol dehydrogenase [Dissulfurirhabdus thermomarina]
MQPFTFHNPTRILFGPGLCDQAGAEIRPFSDRVLLVTGTGSAKRTGAYDRVRRSLEAAGVRVRDLEGVVSNPRLSKVREGIEATRAEALTAVVALGGGSVMDTAKAVAAGAVLDEGDVWDCFTRTREIAGALPVFTVPTLAASGSEMNGFMVITNEETGHKLAAGSEHLYPRLSILDPVLTCSVPPDYTAYGGADAVCHLLEPYFNGSDPDTPLQDRLAEALIQTLLEATEAAVARPGDVAARSTLMWGATLALNGLTRAGIGEHFFAVHMIEHALSALFDVPHGAGLAALLPGWMSWRAAESADKVAQLGRRLWNLSGGTRREEARQTIAALRDWLRRVGCPTSLSELGISAGDHGRIAENAALQAGIWGVDALYTPEVVAAVLAQCQEAA